MSRSSVFAFFLFIISSCFFHSAIAQQSHNEEDESLKIPASVAHEVGIFKEINSIPELIRRTKPFARMLYEMQHATSEDGTYDRQSRIEAFEQSKADFIRDEMTPDKVSGSKLPVFANAWTNIGPKDVAGCTKALTFHPSDGNIIYAGAAAGGVWKSTNAGSSWSPLTDLVLPDLAVASIAVSPASPSTLFVGSGDPSYASDGLPGTGLYKSTDAGSSWSHIATITFPGTINKVLVHPTDPSIVYACSFDNNKGLYRSTNGGTSFTRVFPATKSAEGPVWDLAFGAVLAGKHIMYLLEGNNPGGTSKECGIYKSLDDGATWGKIALANLPQGDSIGKAALGLPDDKTKIYCFIAKPDGNLLGLYRSVTSGAAFTKVAVPQTIFNPINNGAQGWYDLYFAIGPGSAITDTLYIGGVEAYYSFNSGNTWTSYSDYNTHFDVHVDHQSIALDPTNSRKVYIGTDGGIYRSLDAGQNWNYRSTGFATMRFYHIGLDKSDFKKTYGGAQDQGTWRIVSGQNPENLFGGDGFQPIVNPGDASILYTEGPFGDIFKSTDGGITFTNINGAGFESTSDWNSPFAMAPKNSSTLFTGRTMLWKTVNAGSSWSSISPTFGTSFIEAIGLSPSNASVFWIGLDGGKIKLTLNGGTSWDDKSTGTPNAQVRYIACHPTNKDFALASFLVHGTGAARVMRTTNGGTSWTNVSGTNGKILPGVPVNCVALDSVSPSTVWYAATDNGIYYTRDSGATWSIAGSGLGLAACWDVKVHANKVTVRVGTHGRSMWEANVNILPVELTGLVATKTLTGTRLDWKTDSERSNSGFWVERSFNYEPFEDLAFIPGVGNSNTEHSYSYFDPKHDNGYYIYRLKQVDLDGSTHLSNIVDLTYGESLPSITLYQNFPNPFYAAESKAGSTRIRYDLSEASEVTLRLFSLSGVTVRTLVDRQTQSSGEQDAFWDGKDDNGKPVAAGVYYYVLETSSGNRLINKMILVNK